MNEVEWSAAVLRAAREYRALQVEYIRRERDWCADPKSDEKRRLRGLAKDARARALFALRVAAGPPAETREQYAARRAAARRTRAVTPPDEPG